MGTLRKQMEADMALRGLAYRTRQAYIESVAKFAKFYGKLPDQITTPESQRHLLHLLAGTTLRALQLLTFIDDKEMRYGKQP